MVAFHVSEEEDKEIALGNHRRRPQTFSLTGTQPHVGSWRLLAWSDLAPQSEQASTDAVIHAVPRPTGSKFRGERLPSRRLAHVE